MIFKNLSQNESLNGYIDGMSLSCFPLAFAVPDVIMKENLQEDKEMDYEFDDMMEFEKLGLYFEAHMAGMDGECVLYSVYFENGITEDKITEIEKAVDAFVEPYNNNGQYMGYIDISKEEDKASIYLDLGNVEPEDCDTAIQGILKALNDVSGIKTVILNEDCC